MHRFRLALIVGAIVVAAVFVAGGAASLSKGSSTQAKSGGTVVFGAEQEPPCLNGFLSGCNNTWTSWTVGTQFRGLYIQNSGLHVRTGYRAEREAHQDQAADGRGDDQEEGGLE